MCSLLQNKTLHSDMYDSRALAIMRTGAGIKHQSLRYSPLQRCSAQKELSA